MLFLVLAGGLGTRLGSLTKRTPKPLLKINGQPVIDRIIRYIRRNYPQDPIFVNVHYKYQKIVEHLGDKVFYLYEPELLGTAGTIKKLSPLVKDHLVVINGDTLTDLDLYWICNFHIEHEKDITVFWDKDVCGGVMVFSKKMCELFPEKGMIDDTLKNLSFFKYKDKSAKWIDMGTPEKLKKAIKMFK